LCPLCGQANRCVMELARETGLAPPPCWCTQVDFSAELLASIPADLKDRACICPSCARGAARV
jgi:hypothetical protein